ncbi:mfs multidrug transporter [Diaporthe amygdali]|uniref:mfs multidrug transporter n=1 Tax=Phomopsis amygdali TaxID=1214568 RepID=UPI0022FEB55E|nr:mfs multidrug transporter [Diaporthe amygdali]KAJ0118224.1 mfs multidrug transporter [Diaporthe amygdali]
MDRRRHPPVPTIREVVPGAGVNIVLKADQPTGRTVQGVIGQVLTRGNHPRGIKVRLTDGRVGRVQTMSSTSSSSSGQPGGSAGFVGGVQDTEVQDGQQPGAHVPGNRPFRGRRRDGGGDIRYAEEPDLPPQQIGLDAYVKEKKPKKQGRGKGNDNNSATAAEDDQPGNSSAAGSQTTSEAVACPVCGEFEGDEAAVAHHVASHFDDTAT